MESVRDPKHPDLLFKSLPTDVCECIKQIRYYGETLYKYEALGLLEVIRDCEEVLIHLRYRYYKLLTEELDRDALSYCLIYELRFPSLVYSTKVECVTVTPIVPLFPDEDEDEFFDAVETQPIDVVETMYEDDEVTFDLPVEEVLTDVLPDELPTIPVVLADEVLTNYSHMSVNEVESVQRRVVECQNVDWSIWGSVDPDSLYSDFDAGMINVVPVLDDYSLLRSVTKYTLRDGVAYLLHDQRRQLTTLQDLALRTSTRGFADSFFPFPTVKMKSSGKI